MGTRTYVWRTGYTPLVVRRKTARRNLNKQRAARRARVIKRKLAQTPKQPTITQKWVPKEHEESVVTVNMVGKAGKEGQNGPLNRFRHPSCSVVWNLISTNASKGEVGKTKPRILSVTSNIGCHIWQSRRPNRTRWWPVFRWVRRFGTYCLIRSVKNRTRLCNQRRRNIPAIAKLNKNTEERLDKMMEIIEAMRALICSKDKAEQRDPPK